MRGRLWHFAWVLIGLALLPGMVSAQSRGETITVSSTAVGLSATTLTLGDRRQATACVFRVATDDIRLWYDGQTPTSSVGHLYETPSSFQISGNVELRALRMIRVTTDATVTVTCSYGPPVPALAAAGGGGGSGGDVTSNSENIATEDTLALVVARLDTLLADLSESCLHDEPGCTEGGALIGVFDDAATDSVDEGDAGVLRISANRNLFTTLRDAAGNERGANINASNQLAIAGPVTNAGTFAVQVDGAALTALQLIDNLVTDPCAGTAKTYLPIDITTTTTTEITPSLAGSSNHYYICALHLITTAANNVALVDDNTDGCGSVTAGLAGGLTAAEGWNFAANGGIALGNGNSSIMRTVTTNAVLCLVTSANTQLSGHMEVVAAP